MAERKTTPKSCAAQTAMPLDPAPDIVADAPPENPVEKLLGCLYQLALDGNVSAAKLYLDYLARRHGEEPPGLTSDEALLLLRQRHAAGEAG